MLLPVSAAACHTHGAWLHSYMIFEEANVLMKLSEIEVVFSSSSYANVSWKGQRTMGGSTTGVTGATRSWLFFYFSEYIKKKRRKASKLRK